MPAPRCSLASEEAKRHDRRACTPGRQAPSFRSGARFLSGCRPEAYAVHVRAAVEAVRRSFDGHGPVSAAWADMLASRWREEPLATSEVSALQAAGASRR